MNAPQPKTLAEKLDAASSPEEFGAIVLDLFSYVDETRQREEADAVCDCGTCQAIEKARVDRLANKEDDAGS